MALLLLFEKFKEPDYSAQDIVFTAKENTVYAICLGWPEESVLIKSFAGTAKSSIKSVSMLGIDEVLDPVAESRDLQRGPGFRFDRDILHARVCVVPGCVHACFWLVACLDRPVIGDSGRRRRLRVLGAAARDGQGHA